MARPIVLLKVGKTFDELVAERGDYDVWFREALDADDMHVIRAAEGESLPDPSSFGGVVITGSSAMVTDRAPWSVASADFVREAIGLGLPVLGVCYGHQLLADALGGSVDWNPRGRQIGTVEATLTEAGRDDLLLGGLGQSLVVQTSHRQHVTTLPPDATLLASSPRDPHHAFRLGSNVWGVQFHPEFDHEIAAHYIAARADAIREEGNDPGELLANVRPSPHGHEILRRFGELVRPA